MKCKICGDPVVLAPGAAERAAKNKETPTYYTKLFPTHTTCQLAKNKAEQSAAMGRARARMDADRVVVSTFRA